MTCAGADLVPAGREAGDIRRKAAKLLRKVCSGGNGRQVVGLICLVLAASFPLWAQSTIRIRGEDTMVYLAQQCSTLYQRERGKGAPLFDIAGGGRAAGVTALALGRSDITQVRSVLNSNLDSLGRRVVRLPIGIEFAVVYVHATNPVQELSVSDLRAIFSGKVTNWRQVGGHHAAIHLLAGESTTGMTDYFEHAVLQGQTPASVWGKSSAKELVDAVAADPFAIGYTGFRPRDGVRMVRIRKGKSSPGVDPTISNLRTRTYPLTRFVYWYLPTTYRPEVRSFAQWVFSSHGQTVIESIGYMPLLPPDRDQSLAALGGQH